MSLGKLVMALSAACLLLAGAPASALGSTSSGIPPQVTAAAKTMKCTIEAEIYSSPGESPTFHGEDCKQGRFGQFTVRRYDSAQAASASLVHGVLAGHPEAYFAKKGHLFVIPVEPGSQYNEDAARWAAKKIGGKAIHGQ